MKDFFVNLGWNLAAAALLVVAVVVIVRTVAS